MSKKGKDIKTNAVRLTEAAGIHYETHTYDIEDGLIDGMHVAQKTGLPPEKAFKTLVLVGNSKEHYVCVVPVNREVDLKKAAKYFGEKKIEMIRSRELLGLTGYIHGGCSPIGMKKLLPTVFDKSAIGQETICVSGGKVGLQIEIEPRELAHLVKGEFSDIAKED